MKILISAFSFEPSESSEPGVGWRFANIIAKKHEVWVLTAAFPGPIARTTKYLAEHPDLKIRVIPFCPRPFSGFLMGKFVNIHYWLWQRQIISHARQLHAEIGFDVIHHLTFSRYWVPSSLIKLSTPFIFGPVGAGNAMPPWFGKDLPLRSRFTNHLRNAVRYLSGYDPLLRRTLSEAAMVFAINHETEYAVRKLGATNVSILPQVGFSEERFKKLNFAINEELTPFRLLSIGRCLYWKGFHLGILAVAKLVSLGYNVEYKIIGTGPFTAYLKTMARTKKIEKNVKFLGRLSDEGMVLQELKLCHVLLHPALHETFGNVCLEAMAVSRPVICLNTGGPAMQVSKECGFAVTTESVNSSVDAMVEAITSLANNKERLKSMSYAAQKRAYSHFHIQCLEEQIESIYNLQNKTK